jgi:hypothetical protein
MPYGRRFRPGIGSILERSLDLFHGLFALRYLMEASMPVSTVAMAQMRMLAYLIASLRGLDVHQPRNLAKSVTVE